LSALEPAIGFAVASGHKLRAESAGPRRALADKPVKSKKAGSNPRRGLVTDGQPSTKPPPSAGRRFARLVWDCCVILVIALVISSLIRNFAFEQFRVPTGSMEQTLYGERDEDGRPRTGDRILVSKLGSFHRGDIIVFEDNLGWLAQSPEPSSWLLRSLGFVGLIPDSSKGYLVKRLIGLPGDHVTCCNAAGQIEINGQPLDEPYLHVDENGVLAAPSAQEFDLVVPADHVFVLGDNRPNSADSRYHLCVGTQRTPELAFPHVNDIVGPVVAIAWPLNRATLFHTPASFADVPPQSSAGPPEAVVSVYPVC
jgi:signal peptidase I